MITVAGWLDGSFETQSKLYKTSRSQNIYNTFLSLKW